jgi:hypothetical protein
MSKRTIVFILVLILVVASVGASEMRTGVGVGASLGAPFSFNVIGDYNFGKASAALSLGFKNLSAGLGYFDIGLEGSYHLPFTLLSSDDAFMLYPSVGGKIDLQFGVNTIISLGPILILDYQLKSLPVRAFAKANPNLSFATGLFRLSMSAEVGAVYQF